MPEDLVIPPSAPPQVPPTIAPPQMPSSATTSTATIPLVAKDQLPKVEPTPNPVSDVKPPLTSQPPTTPTPPPAPIAPKPTKKPSRAPLFFALVALIVLFVGGISALTLSQDQQDTRNQAQSVSTIGALESVSCAQVTGWTCNRATPTAAIQVALYYDTVAPENLITTGIAAINRPDIATQCGGTSAHGFAITLPASRLPAGERQIIARAIPTGTVETTDPSQTIAIVPMGQEDISTTLTCQQGPPSEEVSACTMQFTASAPPTTEIACQKESFRDEFNNTATSYTYLQPRTTFELGEVVVYRLTLRNNGQTTQRLTLSDVLSQNNLDRLTFLDTTCGSYNTTTRTLTYTTPDVPAGSYFQCGFRARLSESITQPLIITNTAIITAGNATASCESPITPLVPSPSPSPSPSVSPLPSPTPTPPPVVYYTPGPSPAVGCNMSCASNADCRDSTHICVQTTSGLRCRLETNVSSETCQLPGPPPVQTAEVVEQPPALPVAGSNDIVRAIGVGAAAVLLGFVGLLFL